MKLIYLLIEAGREIDPLTNFYFVAVGASRSDQRALRAITEQSVMHNFYFCKRDTQVSDFLQRVFRSVPNHRPVVSVSATDMARHLSKGTRPTLSQSQLDNISRLMYQINLNFRVGFHA